MPGCISCLFSGLNHEGMSEISLSAALDCLRKKRVFTYDRAASSRFVLSYKFTSQTLTGAGVSCVCSLGSCLFGKREMLQCWGEDWCHRLPGEGPATQSICPKGFC